MLLYIKIYRYIYIWIVDWTELFLSFRVEMIKDNDFVKSFKNIEYNYGLLININRLNSIDKIMFNEIVILFLNCVLNVL